MNLKERVAVDVLLGTAGVVTGTVRIVAAPLVFIAGRGAARARRVWPGPTPSPIISALRERGERMRGDLERVATSAFREVVRMVVEVVLEVVDLTDVVRQHVDLDALVREVDLDAAADRLDLDAVAARLDVDAVVSRVDLDGIVAKVDVDAVVSRVDLDGIVAKVDVAAVASRVDVDELAGKLDLGRVIARLDLDAVAKRLDVDAVVARVDLDAVLGRLDLPGIAMEVITAIDLPAVVRESTGPAASEVVRGIRAEGVQADDVVARLVDRVLHRRRAGPEEVG